MAAHRFEHAPTNKYCNTYRTTPEESKKFRVKPVSDIINKVLSERLGQVKYSAERSRVLSVPLAEEIKSHVKRLGYQRYKIICVVHIGSLDGQDVRVASRCLWDENQDRAASGSFCNESLFASATVFGVYHE
ncbi:predicted protein [Nematostella vectensis]|uniref:Uncharacterized protein n=2 Tax=Nematostella vectensis TaxID=45351 RepID=A7RNP6_NEMVE|nr:predicted protein [Nematostella vectensis]|eukprot:XP_001638954.1 predicted protein [Nematostella vectensis]